MSPLVLQRILLDFFLHIFYFPVWWYTRGFVLFLKQLLNLYRDASQMFAVSLWMKNIFVPMFGQSDWQGRIMSFFMRVANIFFRSIGLLIWALCLLGLVIVWLLLPIFFTYGLWLILSNARKI